MSASTDRAGRAWARATVALTAAVIVVAAGCGGASKPAYCTDRSNLESSIKDLPSATSSGGVSALQDQLTTIQSDASSLASSAKSDFPDQTAAVKTSVDTLSSAVKAAPSNPSTSQIAAIAADAASVVSAVKSFSSATKSKCS